jgi:hypothetical protein
MPMRLRYLGPARWLSRSSLRRPKGLAAALRSLVLSHRVTKRGIILMVSPR